MCDACTGERRRTWDRRSVLRATVASGVAAATSPWWHGSAVAAAAEANLGARSAVTDPGVDPAGEDGSRGLLFTSGAAAQRAVSRPPGVVVTEVIPAPNLGGPPAPHVVPRAAWHADESIRSPRRAFAPIRKLVVHHSATPSEPADPAGVVRAMYERDVVDRGYGDIGYNFVIDHHGVIYEGRYSRRYGDEPITGEDHRGFGVVGAHAKNMNAGTCGICLIGNFETGHPTAAALASLTSLLAWKAGRHRIDATAADQFENVYGDWRQFGNVAGHRNIGDTLCPGRNLYAQLPGMRDEVAGAAGHWPTLIADVPRLQRVESSPYGEGPLGRPTTGGTTTGGGTATGSSGGSAATAIRAVSASGQVFTAGSATAPGQPGTSGGSIAGISNPGHGEGYVTVSTSGHVTAFGGLTQVGDARVPSGATITDIAATPTGAGYWVLASNGAVQSFGDARILGRAPRATSATRAIRLAARPQGDGVWVLTDDGRVAGLGAAATLGGPPSGARNPAVDLAPTRSGAGYWVLLADGSVSAHGDATSSQGLAGVGHWAAPAAAIVAVGHGFAIGAHDGGLWSFAGAPWFGSFAGSGATIVGLATAAR
jgi:N-acetylmuramoyl-L-alanine amidase